MTDQRKKVSAKKEWPVVVYFGAGGLGFLGYVIARIALDGSPHPIHWAFAFGAAVVGFFAGWVWYRFRGDII